MNRINQQNTHIISVPFEYHQPVTIKQAIKLLEEYPDAKVIAGGTDIIPKMKQRIFEPKHLINLKKIPEMKGIEHRNNVIWIGATTKLREIERNDLIQKRLPLLYNCVKSIGSIQIRNMGTIGGNVCNASPAADGALGLVTLDSKIHITGLYGERTVIAQDFFRGPGKTVLRDGELVKAFSVPVPSSKTGTCFISIGRTALDISTVSIAVALTVNESDVENVKIAFGSIAPVPMRLTEVETWLKNKKITDSLIKESSVKVAEQIKPITDVRETAEYRKEASKGMAMEALTRAWRMEGKSQQ